MKIKLELNEEDILDILKEHFKTDKITLKTDIHYSGYYNETEIREISAEIFMETLKI